MEEWEIPNGRDSVPAETARCRLQRQISLGRAGGGVERLLSVDVTLRMCAKGTDGRVAAFFRSEVGLFLTTKKEFGRSRRAAVCWISTPSPPRPTGDVCWGREIPSGRAICDAIERRLADQRRERTVWRGYPDALRGNTPEWVRGTVLELVALAGRTALDFRSRTDGLPAADDSHPIGGRP